MVLHVVDVVEADPLADYLTVRDELRMYNPEFVRRPHVVALNKADVLDDGGAEWMDGVRQGIFAAYDAQEVRSSSSYRGPRPTWNPRALEHVNALEQKLTSEHVSRAPHSLFVHVLVSFHVAKVPCLTRTVLSTPRLSAAT
jgi:GTPase involved in cell partitioning and DNA repair